MATSQISGVIEHVRRAVLLSDGAGMTDGELLSRFLDGRNEDAFAALVKRHGPMVWGVCRRLLPTHHDAEDAFQATFLVLVRKAATVRPREMVGNWLYGVAYMTAHRGKVAAAKGRSREKQVADLPERAVAEPDFWVELRPLLDQELNRLPDQYRAIIVLCDLEAKTRKEVARQLGCPEGTVASRLARARALLAKRLARHGLGASSGALAAVLAQNAVSASVPISMVSSTIKAASLLAAGQAAAGIISVKVAALTERVLKTMVLRKLKVGLILFLCASLIGGARLIYQSQAGPPTAPPVTASKVEAQTEASTAPRKDGKVAEDSQQPPARKQIGRILVSAELRILDGEEAKEKRPNRIILIDPESGDWTVVGDADADNPRLSPDGTTIAFGNERDKGIWTCAADGRNPRRIFDKASTPFWTPDGKHLIVTKETLHGTDWKFEAWQIDPAGSSVTELPLPASDCAIDSSPDGKWITTISNRPQSFRVNGFQIYIVRPDGKNERLLTQGGANIDPRFSPDSNKVLYTGYERGLYRAWTVEIDGGKTTEIYHQEKREVGVPVSACWAPDGKRIALVVHDWETTDDGKLVLRDPEKANYRMVIMDAQGTNRKELKLKNARIIGCSKPEWR
jgi:RNA polymerase sigma factor (sigma-70 family)